MPTCVLRYCSNNSKNTNKAQGITFHGFPQPGHEKREAWIKFVQKNRSEETWLPSNSSRVCSAHFKEEHKYYTKKGRQFLKRSAVPCDNPTNSDEPEVLDPLSEEVLDPLSEEVSSSESIFDTPKKILLKKILHKESAAKKRLAEKFKKIKRHNFYLKKKCAIYERTIQILKSKLSSCKCEQK